MPLPRWDRCSSGAAREQKAWSKAHELPATRSSLERRVGRRCRRRRKGGKRAVTVTLGSGRRWQRWGRVKAAAAAAALVPGGLEERREGGGGEWGGERRHQGGEFNANRNND
ncbi:hypothetical protein E2562_028235 [Oryza meyeriana var. granulata]|uniref:Uncharacterized protein n=1 Tax=Oryza meyeriana var. granulata TaxID=110450 RepID=A0A6G1DPJ2_9ORYZ|nr:hypothetical protein E2562_028235 [Oryza meyeriana var. granulata]